MELLQFRQEVNQLINHCGWQSKRKTTGSKNMHCEREYQGRKVCTNRCPNIGNTKHSSGQYSKSLFSCKMIL